MLTEILIHHYKTRKDKNLQYHILFCLEKRRDHLVKKHNVNMY
jgi:REP element-mobilizing transposase RayT